MGLGGVDWRRVAIQAGYYLITLICLGIACWALRFAYLYYNVQMVWWILLYLLVALYVVVMTLLTLKIRRGIRKVAFHTLTMQAVPLIAAIVTFSRPISTESYTPLMGKAQTYERHFSDLQPKQKRAALKNGLPPFKSRAEIESQYKKLRRAGKLVHIESNTKYIIGELSVSSPYVVPKVEELLEDIAERFQAKTQSKSRFVVTSVLRTEEDIARLKKTNGNASSASCHCNATTIDISYVRFGMDALRPREKYELRLALAQTLHELREEGRCFVKIERKQYCYHITVR